MGFRGSGQNYRKVDGDFVFVINFQGSRWGDNFYVNLGAQPVFVPAEGKADLTKLKEYECILRRRVGRDWPSVMSDEMLASLEAEIDSTQAHSLAMQRPCELRLPPIRPRNSSGSLARERPKLEQPSTWLARQQRWGMPIRRASSSPAA
jgi:hypothetical protein